MSEFGVRLPKAEYQIAYRIREEKRQVEVVLVKSRERFYEVLARLTGQH